MNHERLDRLVEPLAQRLLIHGHDDDLVCRPPACRCSGRACKHLLRSMMSVEGERCWKVEDDDERVGRSGGGDQRRRRLSSVAAAATTGGGGLRVERWRQPTAAASKKWGGGGNQRRWWRLSSGAAAMTNSVDGSKRSGRGNRVDATAQRKGQLGD